MSDSRNQILERIRAANHSIDAPPSAAETRLRDHPRGPQPELSESGIERFAARLERAAATVTRAQDPAAVVAQVVAYLEEQRIEPAIVTAPHRLLDALPWSEGITAVQRPVQDDDSTVLTVAFAGVAETGSLVMLSRPETPTGFNFLPDNYLCVIQTSRIVDHLEDVWTWVREESGGMPRSLNFITGPSRTADVEQTIQLGAHGPRRLHAILLSD